MTDLTVTTKKPAEGYLSLRQNWIAGEDGDGLTFDLDSTAGLGGATLLLTVRRGDKKVTEVLDIRPLVEQWVAALEPEVT